METVQYIRHPWKGKRTVAPTPDFFSDPMPPNVHYQDVLSVTGLDENNFLIFTMGRHDYPANLEANSGFRRWMVLFIKAGEVWCENKRLGCGDFVVFPMEHSKIYQTKQESALYYWFTTNDEEMSRILAMCGYGDTGTMVGHCEQVEDVVEEFERTIYQPLKPCNLRLCLLSRLTAIVSLLSAGGTQWEETSDSLFKRCLNYIEGVQGKISVDDLARSCYVSRRYLYSIFKKYKNTSPTEYIQSVRMRAADYYLTTSDFSVSKIAELMGYSDYTHFTRAYTKYYNIAPSKRRQQIDELEIESSAADDLKALPPVPHKK